MLINLPTAPPSWNLTRWSVRTSAETTAVVKATNKTATKQQTTRRMNSPPDGENDGRLIPAQQASRIQYFIFADEKEFFEGGRIRHGRVERAEDAHRRIKRFECLLLDDGGDAFADAAGSRVFVHDQHAIAMTRNGKDRIFVQRRQRSEIEHCRVDAFTR